MCLAKAFTPDCAGEHLILENVAEVTIDGNEVTLRSIMNERYHTRATKIHVDLVAGKIVLESVGD